MFRTGINHRLVKLHSSSWGADIDWKYFTVAVLPDLNNMRLVKRSND